MSQYRFAAIMYATGAVLMAVAMTAVGMARDLSPTRWLIDLSPGWVFVGCASGLAIWAARRAAGDTQ